MFVVLLQDKLYVVVLKVPCIKLKTLLNVENLHLFILCSFQKHVSMGQCVKSSRYLAMIPPVTIECAEVDGDSTSTPIFFEDRYVNRTGT